MHDIIVKNLNHYYGKTQALFDINCTMKAGKTIVLLGQSGAGKSTFIRTLNLLEIPASGSLEIAGKVYDFSKKISESEILKLRRKVGMVFQNYNLWPHKTVLQNLTYVPVTLKQLTKEQALVRAEKILKRLGILEHENKYPLQLSGGQQQRVAIARALMVQPEVLMFDEPTAALDPSITAQVAEIINELKADGVMQIIVTHDVTFAKLVADEVIFFDQGKLIEQGSANKIFNNPQTERLQDYLRHTEITEVALDDC